MICPLDLVQTFFLYKKKGLGLSFACICLFEIDEYTDLFQHVDAVGSVALLCLFYALTHLAFINYEKLGQFSFDWGVRGLLLLFAGFAVFALPCEIWQGIFIACCTIFMCLYMYLIQRDADRFVSPLSG